MRYRSVAAESGRGKRKEGREKKRREQRENRTVFADSPSLRLLRRCPCDAPILSHPLLSVSLCRPLHVRRGAWAERCGWREEISTCVEAPPFSNVWQSTARSGCTLEDARKAGAKEGEREREREREGEREREQEKEQEKELEKERGDILVHRPARVSRPSPPRSAPALAPQCPQQHAFGKVCLERYLRDKPECPQCRAPMNLRKLNACRIVRAHTRTRTHTGSHGWLSGRAAPSRVPGRRFAPPHFASSSLRCVSLWPVSSSSALPPARVRHHLCAMPHACGLALSRPKIRSIVDRLQVYCTYRDRGCSATVAMEAKNSHEDVCGYAPVSAVPCFPTRASSSSITACAHPSHVQSGSKAPSHSAASPAIRPGLLPQPGLLCAARAAKPRGTH